MEVPEELRVAAELAVKTASAGGPLGRFAHEIGRLLAAAIPKLEVQQARASASQRLRDAKGREYLVQGERANEALIEYRLSGKAKPMRCPKSVYEAMVQVLESADRPLSVEEIATGVEKVMGVRPADFQMRVPLRLWMNVQPPLLSRNRARYRASAPQTVQSVAHALWSSLISSTK